MPIVEIKVVECFLAVHKAQPLSYMKLMDAPIGLLINFHVKYLKEGVSGMVLRGANLEDVDFVA